MRIENRLKQSFLPECTARSITMHFPRSTVKCGIAEFRVLFCLNEKEFIAIIIHSKRRSVYFSGYKWIVNTLTLTKSSIGVARSANLSHRKSVLRGHHRPTLHTHTTVANTLMHVVLRDSMVCQFVG